MSGDGLVAPLNAPAAAIPVPGVQPGTTGPFITAIYVIIYGPAGTPTGLFVYQPGTTPGPGNPPVLSVTEASADPYGNAVDQGFVSYGAASIVTQLTNGQLNIGVLYNAVTGNEPASISSPDGVSLLLSSGLDNDSDTFTSLSLQPASAAGASYPDGAIFVTGPLVEDSWHSMSLLTGFTAGGQTPEYTLLPDGRVLLRGSVSLTATHAAGTAFWTCPTGYKPAVAQFFATPNSLGSYALGGYSVHMTASNAQTGAAGVSGNFITLDGVCYVLSS